LRMLLEFFMGKLCHALTLTALWKILA